LTGAFNVAYEKACLLFNIAAIYSELATMENTETNDGIKNACKYFRVRWGC
jgi:programmed cell death 6-interacting protein